MQEVDDDEDDASSGNDENDGEAEGGELADEYNNNNNNANVQAVATAQQLVAMQAYVNLFEMFTHKLTVNSLDSMVRLRSMLRFAARRRSRQST